MAHDLLLDEHWQVSEEKINKVMLDFIQVKDNIKELEEKKDFLQSVLMSVDDMVINKKFGDKFIKPWHRYSYTLEKWFDVKDVKEAFPEAVTETINKEKLWELNPSAVKRTLSRRLTAEKFDANKHRTEN